MNITYRHRQAILESQDGDHTKVGLVVSDKIDWKTNSKKFKSKAEYTKWMFELASQYNVDLAEFTDCMDDLIKDQFYKLTQAPRNSVVLVRTMPKGWGV